TTVGGLSGRFGRFCARQTIGAQMNYFLDFDPAQRAADGIPLSDLVPGGQQTGLPTPLPQVPFRDAQALPLGAGQFLHLGEGGRPLQVQILSVDPADSFPLRPPPRLRSFLVGELLLAPSPCARLVRFAPTRGSDVGATAGDGRRQEPAE